jgi:hypothetical protein
MGIENYNAGSSPSRTVLVDPITGIDYTVGGTGTSANQVQGNTGTATTDAGNPVKIGGLYTTTPPTLTTGQRGDALTDANGVLLSRWTIGSGNAGLVSNVNGGMADGSNNLVVTYRLITRGEIFNGGTWDRVKKPALTARLLTAAASTNDTLVRAGIGDLFRIQGYNANAAARYLKLYNKATAPTSADTPIMTRRLAPQSEFVLDFPTPFYFSLGIGYRLTTGVADADTGALTAGDVEAMNIAYA